MREEDKEQVRALMKEMVADTVAETLTALGLRAHEPLELQQDMAYLAKLRRGAEGVKVIARDVAIKTCFGALVATVIYVAAAKLGIELKLN